MSTVPTLSRIHSTDGRKPLLLRMGLALTAAMLLFSCHATWAAFDAFLKIASVTGESIDGGHEGWIEIESFSTGIGRPSAQADTPASFQDVSILKAYDKASPILYKLCAGGEQVAQAILEIREAEGTMQVFLRWTFEDMLVTSVRPGGLASGDQSRPLEEVTLNFRRVTWQYFPPPGGGDPITERWDLDSPILKEREGR